MSNLFHHSLTQLCRRQYGSLICFVSHDHITLAQVFFLEVSSLELHSGCHRCLALAVFFDPSVKDYFGIPMDNNNVQHRHLMRAIFEYIYQPAATDRKVRDGLVARSCPYGSFTTWFTHGAVIGSGHTSCPRQHKQRPQTQRKKAGTNLGVTSP